MLRKGSVPSILALVVLASASLAGPSPHAIRAAGLAADGDTTGATAEMDKIGTVADVTIGTAVASLALGIEGDTDIAAGIAAVQDACG